MELTVDTRTITGKKVKTLRRQGITPVHIFGHGIEPMAAQCDTAELKKILAKAGTTHIISLKLGKEKKARNVMVREVQKAPVNGELVHVDLYQIRMEEKLKVEVPLVLVGEAPALKLKENFLAHELNKIEVECLPDAIPESIEIDISGLEEAEQGIHVGDIKLESGVTVLTNPDVLIARISQRHVEAETEEAPVAETETPKDEASED